MSSLEIFMDLKVSLIWIICYDLTVSSSGVGGEVPLF